MTRDLELTAFAAAWDQAIVSNDPEAIGRFMADDWLIVGSDGARRTSRRFSNKFEVAV